MASRQDPHPYPNEDRPTRKRDRIKTAFRKKKDLVPTQNGAQSAMSNPQGLEEPAAEPSTQNSLGGPVSSSAGLEPQSSLNANDSDIDDTAFQSEVKPKDLWEGAYRALKIRKPDLVEAYETILASTDSKFTDAPWSPDLITSVVTSKLNDRETNQWIIQLRKRPIKIREQGEKIIKFILWSKDLISQVVSAQPYAALAWSGVSLLLPVSSILKRRNTYSR